MPEHGYHGGAVDSARCIEEPQSMNFMKVCDSDEEAGVRDNASIGTASTTCHVSPVSPPLSSHPSFSCDLLHDCDPALLWELPNLKRSSDLSLTAGAFSKPLDGAGLGEDSYFISIPALGVADGVGGLEKVLGHSSKDFADDLMIGCQRAAQLQPCRGADPCEKAERILREGYKQVNKHGAATAVVAYFDSKQNQLGVASLGDSGVIVMRRPTVQNLGGAQSSSCSGRSSIVFRSPSQQHDFNLPYQLSRLPEELKHKSLRSPDQPSDSLTFDVEVEEGDLILMYSDGVVDNLHEHDLLEICDRAMSPYAAHALGLHPDAATAPELIAKSIVLAAYVRSGDQQASTPFAEDARKAGRPQPECIGGKEDDITCIASWVSYEKPEG